nr:hypothetical protein [Gammaproteobacteria bacterium]
MGTILNETVSADAYTEIIRPSSDKMITGTYQYNQGSGNLVAALTLQCCDD